MIGRGTSRLAWRDGDIVMVSATALVGLVLLVAAWFGASGSGSPMHTATWLNVAAGGFAVFGAGNFLWLLRGRRAIGERRVALISLEPADGPPAPPRSPRAGHASSGPPTALRLVTVPGMARVHDPDCPLVAHKPVRPASAGDGDPCGVCQP